MNLDLARWQFAITILWLDEPTAHPDSRAAGTLAAELTVAEGRTALIMTH